MSDTPETDAKQKLKDMIGDEYVSVELSRKLEHERDEAREQRDDCLIELEIVTERLKGNRHPDDNGIMAKGEIDIKAITEQRDKLAEAIKANHNGTLMLEQMIYAAREQRDEMKIYADKLAEGLPDGMLPKDVEVLREANTGLAAELTAITEQRDRLAAVLQRIRDGYGGQLASPNCCEDCNYLLPIDEALQSLTTTKQ